SGPDGRVHHEDAIPAPTLRTVASRARARAEARSGQLAVPPAARVDSAPTAQPSAAASGRARPRSRPVISPALKPSPAPVASTGVTGGSSARCHTGPSAHRAPRSPSLTTSLRPAAVRAPTPAGQGGSPAIPPAPLPFACRPSP